ncbi:MAG: RNA polymerase factor sigma-54 [Flavobacteriales bacterium]|nr:RNA polymerase factor sigma-54 [Flavobacteriales bacterium]
MLKQNLQHKLLQKLSPQQIQLMKLLQVPTVELEQRIKEEIETNPALEEGREENDEFEEQEERESERDDNEDIDITDYMDEGDVPSYKLNTSNRSPDDDDKNIPFASGKSFQDYLEDQIGLKRLTEKQVTIAKTIIGNLDESGYLRRELENIVNDLAFSQNVMTDVDEIEEVLTVVQDLDPAGIAARDLKECLLLQIERKDDAYPSIAIAKEVLENHFEAFTKKHYDKILRKLDIDDEDLKLGIQEITRLNPKPGNSVKESNKALQQVIPDFIISSNNEGELQLTLNRRNAPELKVSRSFHEMLSTYNSKDKTKKDKEAIMFVKQKIDSAKWFIDAIKQRQQTLLLTMNAIMEYQKEYFQTGDETKIKPMILKDIAEIVKMDISTISRVANSKYAQTDYGTFLLKTFFSESLSTESGEEVSTREVKKILQDSIENEDKKKPLTDERLAKVLKEKGYNIARRTVAKYREQLNIPVARLRKQL